MASSRKPTSARACLLAQVGCVRRSTRSLRSSWRIRNGTGAPGESARLVLSFRTSPASHLQSFVVEAAVHRCLNHTNPFVPRGHVVVRGAQFVAHAHFLGGRPPMAENNGPATSGAPIAEAPPRSGEPALLLTGTSKAFGAVQALRDVDFEVWSGEVVGLVGDNGAGKSTLIKVIAGVNPADAGHIFVEGKEVHIATPTDATRLGIETVYQDLALCDNLDAVANLYLGREDVTPRI